MASFVLMSRSNDPGRSRIVVYALSSLDLEISDFEVSFVLRGTVKGGALSCTQF
jgi:hypothetical protein